MTLSYRTESRVLESLPLSSKVKSHIRKGEIYSKSKIKRSKDRSKQSVDLIAASINPKSCRYALRKLMYYENYSKYIGFIKKSRYNEANQNIYFLLSHALMPFNMVLDFKFPRMKSPGKYPFTFEKGMLKGLKGTVTVAKHTYKGQRSCLFYATASWEGKYTGINSTVFEFFAGAMMKIAIYNLMRISTAP